MGQKCLYLRTIPPYTLYCLQRFRTHKFSAFTVSLSGTLLMKIATCRDSFRLTGSMSTMKNDLILAQPSAVCYMPHLFKTSVIVTVPTHKLFNLKLFGYDFCNLYPIWNSMDTTFENFCIRIQNFPRYYYSYNNKLKSKSKRIQLQNKMKHNPVDVSFSKIRIQRCRP